MGKLYPININTSVEEPPHIFAEDVATIYSAIIGQEGILNIGNKLKATIVSNNEIKISDGIINNGGYIARIKPFEEVSCKIENGKVGVKRNDLIVADFKKSEIETSDLYEIKVVKGIENEGDPKIDNDNLYNGGTKRMMLLYRVRLNGLNIEGIDKLFEVHPNFEQKKYNENSFDIKEMYNVEDFICVKRGNLVLFQVSLNGNGQINPNYPYSINKTPIPKELRPNYKAYLHAFSCNGQWGNAREMSIYVSQDGFINYSTPVKQAFFKIAGFWFVD